MSELLVKRSYVNICVNEWRNRFEFKNLLYSKIVGFEMLSKFYIGQSFVRMRFGGRVARVEVTNVTNCCVI